MSYTSFVFFIAYFGITFLLYTVVPKKGKVVCSACWLLGVLSCCHKRQI